MKKTSKSRKKVRPAFRVKINDEVVCTAGLDGLGVVSAHVFWMRRQGEALDGPWLSVGGSGDEESVRWGAEYIPLKAKDEVHFTLLESASADEPVERKKRDPEEERQRRKEYVWKMAQKWGWQITLPEGESPPGDLVQDR